MGTSNKFLRAQKKCYSISSNPTHSSGNPTQHQGTQHAHSAIVAWHWMALLLIWYPALFLLPRFSPPQRRAMAELAALLTRLPNTVLEQFCDAARPLTFHLMQADVPQLFTTNFRTKNAQLFSDTAWVDLDDLQAWLRP
ncbi:hypothetical protein C8J57DRAFT_1245699 [Mycena rebaudengoi]|nr:hypothetical protein C8J57DRAFT_1245699 [Mycena rebaudengoi]